MNDPVLVALVHLGCARNLIDSELILARLAEEGLLVAGSDADADYVVLNTCSFIGPAREESEGALQGLLDRKRRGELRGVVVAGCLVERYQHELVKRFPDVDLFAEISDYRALASAVAKLASSDRGAGTDRVPQYLAAGGLRDHGREGARMLSTPGSYAYLRISHGCDHLCSFCAIPGIRGKHRSKPVDAVAGEAQELIAAGVRELVLVAEDSTAWGRDIGRSLPELVEALAELEGDARVRLMYAYPNRFPWELTTLLREHPKVIPYLDIPIQHVATPVLRAMRRAGSGDQVRSILDRLRDEVPDITLRTTVLVGFPGERAKDVDELVDFVREYELGRLGAFPYSPEEGTAAFDLDGAPTAEEVDERMGAVLAARDDVLHASQQAQVGREIEVLVDEVLDLEYGAIGRTERDAPEVDMIAAVRAVDVAVGDRLKVRVEALDDEANLICSAMTEAAH